MLEGWRFDGGLPETKCGKGSTLAATESIRAWLPQQFKNLKIRSVVDAPCGDCNWISHVDMRGVHYFGFDADSDHIDRARSIGMNVSLLDIVETRLPEADLLVCRDFLQHLPDHQVMEFLWRHLSHGAFKYAAFTCHHLTERMAVLQTGGGYRPLNLFRPPFMWREPIARTPDGFGRILGIWSLK